MPSKSCVIERQDANLLEEFVKPPITTRTLNNKQMAHSSLPLNNTDDDIEKEGKLKLKKENSRPEKVDLNNPKQGEDDEEIGTSF